MPEAIPVAVTKSIRECGFDEFWLQDQIAENPDCLQLRPNTLKLVSREHKQAGGGRLDILLRDPEDDSMYEVEVMLGETDEKHIIHTIEYWDREKRRWPQRQHFAVLVAESITRRFFNVIHLLSQCIPLMAVQANIVEIDGKKVLHFSKVLDTYQEPAVEEPEPPANENYWENKAPWTLEAAKAMLEAVRPVWANAALRFLKSYVVLTVDGEDGLWMWQKGHGKSAISVWVSDTFSSKAREVLGKAEIPFTAKADGGLHLTADRPTIDANKEALSTLANLMQESWNEADE